MQAHRRASCVRDDRGNPLLPERCHQRRLSGRFAHGALNMASRVGTAVAIVLCSTLLCIAEWRVNGKPVPDTSWARSSGDFGAQLVFTDKPDELFAAWEKSGPAVLLSETPKATRGAPIVAVIFFTGCSR